MTEQRAGVEIELGVERDDVAAAREDQRVDFSKRRIRIPVGLVEFLELCRGLANRRLGNANAARKALGLVIGQAFGRIGEHLENLFRMMRGDFLDIHAAFARRHHADALRGAIGDDANVVFLLDIGAFLDKQATHLLALGAGLMRDQLHAQDLGGELAHLIDRTRQLHAAALAPAARVNLGLHHPDWPAELLGGGDSLLDRKRGNAARNDHAKLPEQFLALVLMDFHGNPVRSDEVEK